MRHIVVHITQFRTYHVCFSYFTTSFVNTNTRKAMLFSKAVTSSSV